MLRRLLAIFLPAALLTGAVVLALYLQERAAETSLHEQAGRHLVDLHGDIITRELEAVQSELLYLAGQNTLRRYLIGKANRDDLESDYLLFCRQRGVYDQVRYLDNTGHERIRVNFNGGQAAVVPQSELQSKADRYYFSEAMQLDRGQVFVSAFDLNVEHGQIERPLKPTVRFATPVFAADGTRRGVLVLNYLGAALLDKLAEVSRTFAGTALLLNRQGHYLRGPAPDDEWGFMLRHNRTFAERYPDAWALIPAAGEGQFRTKDGLFTYRTADAPPRTERDPEVDYFGLVVVAHTAPEVLDAASTQALRRLLLLYGAVLLILLPLSWYLAHVGSLRRQRERELAASEGRLRALSSQLIAAQEEERRSISRDLHDEFGQVATAIALDLQRAGQTAESAKKDELIARALSGTGCLLERIHEISTRIRPAMLDDIGLKDAVQSLLSDFERSTGIVPRADLRVESGTVSAPGVSENVYRILQEALTNVARHAQVAEVLVGLHVTADHVALTVRDAGRGFDLAGLNGRRLGILGMRERAELLGGTFDLVTELGRGTEVRVVIPILRRDPT
jgi:signal transduction histidine kinase